MTTATEVDMSIAIEDTMIDTLVMREKDLAQIETGTIGIVMIVMNVIVIVNVMIESDMNPERMTEIDTTLGVAVQQQQRMIGMIIEIDTTKRGTIDTDANSKMLE